MKNALKALTLIAVIMTMAIGVFALTACEGFDLDAYKATAVTAIENYAIAMKAENEYTALGCTAIDSIVSNGRLAVNSAGDKAAVDIERDTAIQAIMNVPKEGDMETGLASQIIQSAWDILFADEHANSTVDDVYIEQYFGTFDESVVVIVWHNDLTPARNAVRFTFEECEFSFNGDKQIRVWNSGEFYTLQEAVDEGFLTIENIRTIHQMWSEK